MTERSMALYKLLSCTPLTVTLQGLGDGVADAVTGQMLYPPTTEYVSTVLYDNTNRTRARSSKLRAWGAIRDGKCEGPVADRGEESLVHKHACFHTGPGIS